MDSEAATPERSAVLILRVMLDRSPAGGLRARLTRSLDISTRDHDVSNATTVEEVCDGVRSWLEAFVLNHARGGGDGTATALETPV